MSNNRKARLYRRLFYYFLKPRSGGSYWSWNYLRSICKHTVVEHKPSENGWVDECAVCEMWLAFDLNTSEKIGERSQKGNCVHWWLTAPTTGP